MIKLVKKITRKEFEDLAEKLAPNLHGPLHDKKIKRAFSVASIFVQVGEEEYYRVPLDYNPVMSYNTDADKLICEWREKASEVD
jgi:hypothetical protein